MDKEDYLNIARLWIDACRRAHQGLGKGVKMKQIDERVLAVLQEYFSQNSYSPTIREIADRLKINSTGYIHSSLVRLRDMGIVSWTPNKVRTLALTCKGESK